MILEFGLLATKPSQQLRGAPIPEKQLQIFDKLADAAAQCFMHGLISDAQYDQALKRLTKMINKELEKVKTKGEK